MVIPSVQVNEAERQDNYFRGYQGESSSAGLPCRESRALSIQH